MCSAWLRSPHCAKQSCQVRRRWRCAFGICLSDIGCGAASDCIRSTKASSPKKTWARNASCQNDASFVSGSDTSAAYRRAARSRSRAPAGEWPSKWPCKPSPGQQVVERGRLALVGNVLHRQRRRHGHHERVVGHLPHRRKVLHRVVGQLGIDAGADGMGGDGTRISVCSVSPRMLRPGC